MDLPFVTGSKRKGTLDYLIHPLFSVSSLLISLIILAASTLFGPPAIAGLIFAFFALLGALYTEHWTFAGDTGIITYVTGFRPFLKKFEYMSADAVSVAISVFAKGELDQDKAEEILKKAEAGDSRQGFFPITFPFAHESKIRLRLVIEFKNGDTVLIDEAGLRSQQRLKALAKQIEAACGIPYYTGS